MILFTRVIKSPVLNKSQSPRNHINKSHRLKFRRIWNLFTPFLPSLSSILSWSPSFKSILIWANLQIIFVTITGIQNIVELFFRVKWSPKGCGSANWGLSDEQCPLFKCEILVAVMFNLRCECWQCVWLFQPGVWRESKSKFRFHAIPWGKKVLDLPFTVVSFTNDLFGD
jgi:hypothetical protein